MNKSTVGAKDFFMWVGAMASLYAGVFAFISLIFDYINTVFPNPVDSYNYYDPYLQSMSYETATLIVVTPIFMLLMRFIRNDMQEDESRVDSWVRRWALFLTLFISAATIVIDLIVLLTSFLQGEEMTIGFLLKVLTVLLVVGAGFLHFLADLRGYWQKHPANARVLNWAVGILVVITIASGFQIVGTPMELRSRKQDAVRVQDLQSIQWQVVNYWQQKEVLPTTLDQLKDPISGAVIPVDPTTGEPYKYQRVGAMTFKLCATFATENAQQNPNLTVPKEPNGLDENWQHGVGEICFDRTIDPERYPPYPKTR